MSHGEEQLIAVQLPRCDAEDTAERYKRGFFLVVTELCRSERTFELAKCGGERRFELRKNVILLCTIVGFGVVAKGVHSQHLELITSSKALLCQLDRIVSRCCFVLHCFSRTA